MQNMELEEDQGEIIERIQQIKVRIFDLERLQRTNYSSFIKNMIQGLEYDLKKLHDQLFAIIECENEQHYLHIIQQMEDNEEDNNEINCN